MRNRTPVTGAALVQKYIGSAYDTVKKVADNLDEILALDLSLGLYLGAFEEHPLESSTGAPLVEGNFYISTADEVFYIYSGATWIPLNQQGEQGIQGEVGPAGPQGEQGEQGIPGAGYKEYADSAALIADASNVSVGDIVYLSNKRKHYRIEGQGVDSSFGKEVITVVSGASPKFAEEVLETASVPLISDLNDAPEGFAKFQEGALNLPPNLRAGTVTTVTSGSGAGEGIYQEARGLPSFPHASPVYQRFKSISNDTWYGWRAVLTEGMSTPVWAKGQIDLNPDTLEAGGVYAVTINSLGTAPADILNDSSQSTVTIEHISGISMDVTGNKTSIGMSVQRLSGYATSGERTTWVRYRDTLAGVPSPTWSAWTKVGSITTKVTDLDNASDGFFTYDASASNTPSAVAGSGWQLSSIDGEYRTQAVSIGNQLVKRYKNGGSGWTAWIEDADLTKIQRTRKINSGLNSQFIQEVLTVNTQSTTGSTFPSDLDTSASQSEVTVVISGGKYTVNGVGTDGGIIVQTLYGNNTDSGLGACTWTRQRNLNDTTPAWSTWKLLSVGQSASVAAVHLPANMDTTFSVGVYTVPVPSTAEPTNTLPDGLVTGSGVYATMEILPSNSDINDGLVVQVLYARATGDNSNNFTNQYYTYTRMYDTGAGSPAWSVWRKVSLEGDFGIGSGAVDRGKNANYLTGSGFNICQLGTPTAARYFVQHITENPDGSEGAWQLATLVDGDGSSIWSRGKTGVSWGSWTEITASGGSSTPVLADLQKYTLPDTVLDPYLPAAEWKRPTRQGGTTTIFDYTVSGNTDGMLVSLDSGVVEVVTDGVYDVEMSLRFSTDSPGSELLAGLDKHTGTDDGVYDPLPNTVSGAKVVNSNEPYTISMTCRLGLSAGEKLAPILMSNAAANVTVKNFNVLFTKVK